MFVSACYFLERKIKLVCVYFLRERERKKERDCMFSCLREKVGLYVGLFFFLEKERERVKPRKRKTLGFFFSF